MPNQTRLLRWGKLFIVIILCGLFSTQAVAASFDCKKATTWLEKTVCSNPELSKLDEELAKAYHDALASLSPEGQKETRQYQRQWLKDISPYSKAKLKLDFDDSNEFHTAEYALKQAYENRIKQLQQSLIRFPGRIFRNVHVDHSKIEKTCDDELINKELTYPQIENPRDENEKFWNNLISKKANDEFKSDESWKCTDIYDEYAVSFSNRHLISIQGNLIWHEHDAAYAPRSRTDFSWLLDDKRELQASDLFDDKTDWRNKLAALVSQRLKEQAAVDKETYVFAEWLDLKSSVTSENRWVISKDGLGVQFDQYECTLPLIRIDWKALGPYISGNGHRLISN